MGLKLANNAISRLSAGISPTDVTVVLVPGGGAAFPTLGAGDYFPATIVKTDGSLEIVKVTARATDVLTVVRAQENTTAKAFNAGDRIELRLTAGTYAAQFAETDSRIASQNNFHPSGTSITAISQWSSIPQYVTDNPDLTDEINDQAQKLANRTQYLYDNLGAEFVPTYAAMRAYAGDATRMQIGGRANYFDGADGVFVRTGSAADNDGTVLRDALGRSWVRQFTGPANAKWWGVGSYPANGTTALQNSLNSGNAHIVIDKDHHVAVTSVTMAADQVLEINGKISKLSGTSPIITINNSCKIVGTGSIDGNSVAATGIDGNAKTDLFVSSLHIFNVGGKGVNLTHCTNYKVANLWLNDITQQGINLDVSSNGEVYGNAVVNALHGIQFWGGDASTSTVLGIFNIAIYGNRVSDVTGGIWGSLGKNIAVSGNVVENCEDVGVDFEGCHSSSMTGNTVSNCHNGGLSLFFGSKHCSISGNTVDNNATSGLKNGIWFTDGANSNNTVTGNTVNTSNGGRSMQFGEGNKYNTVSGNTCTGGTLNAWRLSYSSITSNTLIDGKLSVIGGSYNHVEGNKLIRDSLADATSPNEAPIYISWASSSWPAQVNTVCDNVVIGWSYSITDDCWGDNLSLNDFSNNRVSGPMYHRGTSGWYGRMENNVLISNPNVLAGVSSY